MLAIDMTTIATITTIGAMMITIAIETAEIIGGGKPPSVLFLIYAVHIRRIKSRKAEAKNPYGFLMG